ncbi:MAG: OmpA family protein [Terracidiphilus sp.]|jgi:hypothetical protein
MNDRVLKSVGRVLALSFAALIPVTLAAQVAPSAQGTASDNASKWDIFLGYSYLYTKATVNGFAYNPVNYSSVASITRYFNKNVGFQAEGDIHLLTPENGVNTFTQPNNDFSGGSGGVIFRVPYPHLTPFIHALVGAESVGSYAQPNVWGPVITLGGGLDVKVSHHLAIRLVQADYQWTRADFPAAYGGTTNFNLARLSAGLVFQAGSFVPPPPVQLSCTPSPVTIFPGDPVIITATAGSLDPKDNAIYSWSGSGATGTATTVTISTGSLAPGSYTVTGTVKEGRPGREGLKPWETATCSAVFTVKAYEPPTVSCSASPSTINPGDKSTITAQGVSPQNRPLTYSYSAASGSISGTTATATFDSTGAPTGPVPITCNVADDKGQTATSNTSVTIAAPYVAPVPKTQALCSISFTMDPRRPTRVDNEAKACLDQVALDLQNQADAKVVIVGESNAAEKSAKPGRHGVAIDFAAQRAVNTKEYLVTEKGIDPSRVSVAIGTTDGQTVEDYLVPAGATFTVDVTGTTPVDETVVKPQVRVPLGQKAEHHHHEKAPQQ